MSRDLTRVTELSLSITRGGIMKSMPGLSDSLVRETGVLINAQCPQKRWVISRPSYNKQFTLCSHRVDSVREFKKILDSINFTEVKMNANKVIHEKLVAVCPITLKKFPL